MKFIACEQRSPEWHAARLGHVTGSRMKDLLATRKDGGEAASRKNYRTEKVIELLTGESGEEAFISKPMERGIAKEPFARTAYCDKYDVILSQVGFALHPTIARAGASIDGIVQMGVGGIEIKCPNTAQHIYALINGMDSEHIPQVQWNIAVCELQWIDFVSYDDRMPRGLELYIQRIPRDQPYIDKMEAKVKEFQGEVDATIAALRKKAGLQ